MPTAAKTPAPRLEGVPVAPKGESKKERDNFRYRFLRAPDVIQTEMQSAIEQYGTSSEQVMELRAAIRNIEKGDYTSIKLKYSVSHRLTTGMHVHVIVHAPVHFAVVLCSILEVATRCNALPMLQGPSPLCA